MGSTHDSVIHIDCQIRSGLLSHALAGRTGINFCACVEVVCSIPNFDLSSKTVWERTVFSSACTRFLCRIRFLNLMTTSNSVHPCTSLQLIWNVNIHAQYVHESFDREELLRVFLCSSTAEEYTVALVRGSNLQAPLARTYVSSALSESFRVTVRVLFADWFTAEEALPWCCKGNRCSCVSLEGFVTYGRGQLL